MYNNLPSNSKSVAATAYSNAYQKPLELETNNNITDEIISNKLSFNEYL